MEAEDGNMAVSMGKGTCTMPWIIYLAVPGTPELITPHADFSAEVAYIARLCSGAVATDLTCPVCLEPFRVANNPAQLPCAHFMCIQCIKKLYPVEKKGLKCPVCQRNHATYMVCEHAGAPGGVMIAEVHR